MVERRATAAHIREVSATCVISFPVYVVQMVVSIVLVSMVVGTLAALAALAICSLTAASLSPAGGALLGLVTGATASNRRTASAGRGAWLLTLLGGLAGAATAAVVVFTLR
jgi:hypothetical protein